MKTALAALALVLAAPAHAHRLQPVQAAATASLAAAAQPRGFHGNLYQRYCDKLKEGPEAYAAFVKRLGIVTGYTFTDFAPRDANDAVRHRCRDTDGALIAIRTER